MLGLMVLLALCVYLAISIGVVAWTVRWARRTGRSAKRWGVAVGLVMYLLVFWDHIPTLLLHKYYCATKAGFWVYKTPEQWKMENPGVAETLTWRERSPNFHNPDGTWGVKLNERFIWVHQISQTPILSVSLHNESIIDVKAGETMVNRTSVVSGYGTFPAGGDDWRVLKFWVKADPCIQHSEDFYPLEQSFKRLGREVK